MIPTIAAALLAWASLRLPVPQTLLGSGEPLLVGGGPLWRLRAESGIGPYVMLRHSGGARIDEHESKDHWTKQSAKQDYAFTLSLRGEALREVSCSGDAVTTSSPAIHTGTGKGTISMQYSTSKGTLTCALDAPTEGSGRWYLHLDAPGTDAPSGYLSGPGGRWDVLGTHHVEGPIQPSYTVGYFVRDGARDLAAIELVHGGSVWLAPDLDASDQALLVATAGALLRFREPGR